MISEVLRDPDGTKDFSIHWRLIIFVVGTFLAPIYYPINYFLMLIQSRTNSLEEEGRGNSLYVSHKSKQEKNKNESII